MQIFVASHHLHEDVEECFEQKKKLLNKLNPPFTVIDEDDDAMFTLLDMHSSSTSMMDNEPNTSVDPDPENKILLEPYEYIRTIPGKQIRPKLIKVERRFIHSLSRTHAFELGFQSLASHPYW